MYLTKLLQPYIMIELIVVDSCRKVMFKVTLEMSLAYSLGDKITARVDHNDNYIGREVEWEDFCHVMNRAY